MKHENSFDQPESIEPQNRRRPSDHWISQPDNFPIFLGLSQYCFTNSLILDAHAQRGLLYLVGLCVCLSVCLVRLFPRYIRATQRMVNDINVPWPRGTYTYFIS